ncbi:hypothetical protein CSUI_000335 [Cystoisospora suis]|uniref:Uncharacterized protein n=1 Tax=Cystoisospora suis TaxID=483139 RepID=A0A2C6L1D2_9APIC|nr:hypothetical protein CSUI_000335 [Cystoisospora suis]
MQLQSIICSKTPGRTSHCDYEKSAAFCLGAGAGHHDGDAGNEQCDTWRSSCPPLRHVHISIQATTVSGELLHGESEFICVGSLLVPDRISNLNAGRMLLSGACTPGAGPV